MMVVLRLCEELVGIVAELDIDIYLLLCSWRKRESALLHDRQGRRRKFELDVTLLIQLHGRDCFNSMNTTSLLLTGRTAAVHMATTTTVSRNPGSATRPKTKSRSSSGTSQASFYSASSRPSTPSRQPSWDRSKWYNETDNPTLDDFARRLETTAKRIEHWQSACATNIVMALLRPTPVALFVFNPVSLFLLVVMLITWLLARAVVT